MIYEDVIANCNRDGEQGRNKEGSRDISADGFLRGWEDHFHQESAERSSRREICSDSELICGGGDGDRAASYHG